MFIFTGPYFFRGFSMVITQPQKVISQSQKVKGCILYTFLKKVKIVLLTNINFFFFFFWIDYFIKVISRYNLNYNTIVIMCTIYTRQNIFYQIYLILAQHAVVRFCSMHWMDIISHIITNTQRQHFFILVLVLFFFSSFLSRDGKEQWRKYCAKSFSLRINVVFVTLYYYYFTVFLV